MIAMARRVLIAAFAVLAAFPAVAQQKSPSKAAAAATAATGDDPVVARVNGEVLHRSDLELALRGAPQQVQQAPLDKIYPQLLNSVVNADLLAQAGRKAKVDQNPQVKQQLTAADNEIIADSYVATLGAADRRGACAPYPRR
jgi:peptidyl-prolyl cis-trans isomerase C